MDWAGEVVDMERDWPGYAKPDDLGHKHLAMDGMGRMNRCLLVVEAVHTDVVGAASDLASTDRKVCKTEQGVEDTDRQAGLGYHLEVVAGTGCCCMGDIDSSCSVRRVRRCDDR